MGSLAKKFSLFKKVRHLFGAEDRFYGKLLASSFVGILSIALLAAIFLLIAVRDHNYELMRTRTLGVLRDANEIENDLANLETGHRGFLLTGQQAYLEPFDRRRIGIEERIDELSSYFQNFPQQRDRIEIVRNNVEQWLKNFALPGIEKRRRSSVSALPTANVSADALLGRSLLDDARKALQALQDDEQIQLNSRTRDQQNASLSFQVLVFAPKLESSILEMEKSERGYLLTGDRVCLETYKAAAAEFYAYHGHLSVLLADQPAQIDTLAKIRATLERWQREAATPEFSAKQTGQDVTALVARGHGKELMDDIRVQLGAFERAQNEIYDRARSHAEMERMAKTAAFGLLCVFAMAVLVASSWYSFGAYSKHLRKMENTEAQTRSIIATTLDGVITINDQGLVQSMNPAAEKMFGFPEKEMLGQLVTRIIPQRMFLQDMASLGRGTLMAMGNRQGYYPFPIEISLSEMKVDGKKHYVAFIRDVTERKRSEETLKHIGLGVSSSTGEEFVRSLVKQLSKALQTDFSFLVELTNKNEEDNSCALIIAEHGHIRSRVNFKLANTACEEVLKKGFRAFPKAVRESFPKDDILRELAAESFVAMPLNDHKGRTVGLMGVIDVKAMDNVQIAESTLQIFAARAAAEIERKRFEEDLNAEKERLAVTLRSIGDGFIATDVEGNIAMINNVAERLTGWSQQLVLGKQLAEILNVLNERTRKPSQSMVQRIIETGAVVGTANHAIVVSREGVERLIEISAAPIRDKKNQRIGTVLVFRDITEKEHLEAERRKAEKLESLGVAAGGIAHDFNNLLTAIIGNLSLSLISLAPGEEMFDRLTTAKKASLRAQELAQQLLTFAKGGAPIKKAASISQLIRDTVTFSLRGSNVRTEFWLPEELWPVEIDSGQVSQVINNLAINAEQAMPSGGTLRVRCENFPYIEESAALAPLRPGKYIKITVQDEGIGIPEEYLKKIFDPYFTTKPKGSGLGLATSYSIVKNHEGLITVESRVGGGATFSLYLPATEKELSFEKGRKSAEPEHGEGRILVLDDEIDICEILTCALEPLGYNVTTAQDSLTAIRLYKDALEGGQRFDLVISDLTLPGGMGGAEAVKKLHEIDPTVKAMVSSGYATDPVMSRFREYGFCACITKPYEIADMCHVVNEVISAQKKQNMIFHDFAQAQLA